MIQKFIFLLSFLILIILIVILNDWYLNIYFKSNQIKKQKARNKATLPTIFCLIKTHPNNIQINKTLTVYNVWGRKCDNYRFVTLIPEKLIPKNINTKETFEVFDKFFMIQPKSLTTEDHEKLTLKVYYAMLYVYENFPSYDWYYIVDDDAYANIENFKEYLSDKDPSEAITYGYVIKLFVSNGYHSGGPGYVLSSEAFRRVGSALKANIKNCPNSGIDDVDVNKCVRKYYGKIGVSCDEKNRDRFLVMHIKKHLTGDFPSWMIESGGCKALKGRDCCADSPLAFHYLSPEEMVRMDKAMEIHKSLLKWFGERKISSVKNRFQDLARIYLMLEDIELDKAEYQQYMNISTY